MTLEKRQNELKVVVFDLDDTLYPESDYVLSGFAAVDAWLVKNKNIRQFFPVAEALLRCGRRGDIFDRALEELQATERDIVPELVNIYRNHTPLLRLHSDADWVLSELSRTYSLGLITDGYHSVQKLKVSALSLTNRFQSIIYSDAYGREHWKPSATPYCKLVEELACCHQQCAYIADNPLKDFVTARRLGWRTVQITRPNSMYRDASASSEYLADRQITTLYELPKLLEAFPREG